MRRRQPGNPKLAVAYLRVSTDEQKLGPEAQRDAIEGWATREGARVVAWELDEGVSGGAELDQRAGLVRALGELRAANAGVLVVAKRDRLARDTTVAGLIERAVRQSGGRVAAADGVANGDSPADAFMRSILDAAAQYERALIAARTKAALDVKRQRGERIGSVPLGFRLGEDGRTLAPDAREQVVVGIVRALRMEGRSLRAICAALDEGSIAPREGVRWHPTQVARMLARPTPPVELPARP